MPYSRTACVAAPYAIAFPIEELLLVRSWVRQRDLCLTVATDQVQNGAEFEEMLIIAPAGCQRRVLSLWRTHHAVFAQSPGRRPLAFDTLKDLLGSLRPAGRKRAGWMRLFGFAG